MLIKPYNPNWKLQFEKIQRILFEALDGLHARVEHIGSTSVPGLAAKPIIDIDIIYSSGVAFSDVQLRLAAIGYTHNGDQGIPGREAFKRIDVHTSHPDLDQIAHHLYACQNTSLELERHLLFRDILRRNVQISATYTDLKRKIAEETHQDQKAYAIQKEEKAKDFILSAVETARQMNGDTALAYGALTAGVSIITGYPGSPSSGTMEALIQLQPNYGYHIEWSVNEKVAAEVAIGASIAGCKSLICVKSVGMNVMLDPLMTINLTPVNGGLVILLGDDPGGYGSQNDQDTRPLMHMLQLPMLEPATPAEGYAMMRDAFELSEQFGLPIIIRETRAFSKVMSLFTPPPFDYKPNKTNVVEEAYRFVPVPSNAVLKHKNLHQQLSAFQQWTETCLFNHATTKSRKGIIAAGYAYTKLVETLGINSEPVISIFKLSTLYPLPVKNIVQFLNQCDEILVLEESLPFVEHSLKVIAYDHQCTTVIHGKDSGHIPSEGDLFRWKIAETLSWFIPGTQLETNFKDENADAEKPKKGNPCADCRYEEVFQAIDSAAEILQLDPLFIGDPGCLFKVGDRLLAKYAIGSAVPVASGLMKTGIDRPIVALFGDSGFFHTTIPAICNASYQQSNILMVLLNNGSAKTSGGQNTPASGKNVLKQSIPELHFDQIAGACGVQSILKTHIDEPENGMINTFRKAFMSDQLCLVILEIPDRANS